MGKEKNFIKVQGERTDARGEKRKGTGKALT